MMTDAPSNSYGVDNTFADWGEVFLTAFTLLLNNCRLHPIYYFSKDMSNTPNSNDPIPQIITKGDPSGEAGYNLVSTESGGLFFRINSNETEKAAMMILKDSSSNGNICFYDGEFAKGTTLYTIPVNETVSHLVHRIKRGKEKLA